MLFGCALGAEPGHTLFGARAFGYVSAGFGFGGGGAGAARKQRAGQKNSGDEEDEETKPKCHESHCHLSTRVSVYIFLFYTIFGSFVCMICLVRCTGQKKGRNRTGKIDDRRSRRKSEPLS